MIDRQTLIELIGSYGKLIARGSDSTPEANIAAMKAIEDWCDAAVLAERDACAEIAWGHSGDRAAGNAITNRPAP